MNDQDFRKLLDHLRFSWSGYRKVRKGVKKRITRHMQQIGCLTMNDYIDRLAQDPEARTLCDQLMTVSISRFYRDRQLWKALEETVFPDLIGRQAQTVRIWSAGCACGEEPYSIKIAWTHLTERLPAPPSLALTATDMNSAYLQRARSGIYASSSLKEMDREDRLRFFKKRSGRNAYAIVPALREGIRWRPHHLLQEPPGSDFQVVFLRNNVLTYCQDPLKQAAFRKLLGALAPSGYLVIGSHERLPPEVSDPVPVPPLPYVFKRPG